MVDPLTNQTCTASVGRTVPPCLNLSSVAVTAGNTTCNPNATDWTNTVNCSADFYHRTCNNVPGTHFCHHQLEWKNTTIGKQGDMYSIAKAFGVPLDALCKANGMKQCECLPLNPDNVLKIPVNPTAAAFRDHLLNRSKTVTVRIND
jgi:hypothetical protein